MKILRPHQAKAIDHLSFKKQSALFMEMRLGKNLTILRHIKKLNAKRILVITEYGAMNSFEEELTEEKEKVVVLEGLRKKRLKKLQAFSEGWLVSNYESAERLELHLCEWDVIVLDETIKIANPKAKRTQFFLKAFENVRFRYILNGKPNPNSIQQLACQFLFLYGQYFGCKNFWEYRARFYDLEGYAWTPKPGHIKQVNDFVNQNAFVLTRAEAKAGSGKVYEKRIVRATNAQLEAQKELTENYAFEEVEYKNILGVQIGLAYVAGGHTPSIDHPILKNNKMDELLSLLEREEGKFLIWCHFKCEVLSIHQKLLKKNIPNIFITGDSSKQVRTQEKERFFENPSIKAAVLTIQSCAKGQDWSAADTAIYYSNIWDNDYRGQSEDRLIHLTKDNPVLIIDLITEGSIDEEIFMSLKEKEYTSSLIMNKFLNKVGEK